MKKPFAFTGIALAAFWLGACSHGGGGSEASNRDSLAFAYKVSALASNPTDTTESLSDDEISLIGKGSFDSDDVDEPITV